MSQRYAAALMYHMMRQRLKKQKQLAREALAGQRSVLHAQKDGERGMQMTDEA